MFQRWDLTPAGEKQFPLYCTICNPFTVSLAVASSLCKVYLFMRRYCGVANLYLHAYGHTERILFMKLNWMLYMYAHENICVFIGYKPMPHHSFICHLSNKHNIHVTSGTIEVNFRARTVRMSWKWSRCAAISATLELVVSSPMQCMSLWAKGGGAVFYDATRTIDG